MVLITKTEAAAPPIIKRRLAWCAPAGALCLLAAAGLLTLNPVPLIISYHMRVSEGSAVEQFLTKPVFSVEMSVSLFNITNAARFQSGQDRSLKVGLVGPFIYKETRYNDNFEMDLSAGVMRYEPRSRVEFVPERSAACADRAALALPNLAMLGVASLVSGQGRWARAGFSLLTARLDSRPVVSVSADDYLWGYRDPLLTLAHNLVPGYIDFEKIGFLDRFFDEKSHIEISARDEDKFMIKTRNGLNKLPMGKLTSVDDCEFCDDFVNAYEGLGFPSPTTPDTPIRIFKSGFCKLLPTEFHKRVVYDSGVEGLVFNLSDSFFSVDSNVTKNRMLDLRDCFYGIPLAVSKAYFLDIDPELYERIEGVPKPDPAMQSYFVIEPMIAMELETVVRVQLNLVLPDLSFSSKVSRFSQLVVPIAYLEFIQPPLPEHTQRALRLMYATAPAAVRAAAALLLAAGLALIAHPFILYFRHKLSETETPPVISTQQPLLQSQDQTGHRQKHLQC